MDGPTADRRRPGTRGPHGAGRCPSRLLRRSPLPCPPTTRSLLCPVCAAFASRTRGREPPRPRRSPAPGRVGREAACPPCPPLRRGTRPELPRLRASRAAGKTHPPSLERRGDSQHAGWSPSLAKQMPQGGQQPPRWTTWTVTPCRDLARRRKRAHTREIRRLCHPLSVHLRAAPCSARRELLGIPPAASAQSHRSDTPCIALPAGDARQGTSGPRLAPWQRWQALQSYMPSRPLQRPRSAWCTSDTTTAPQQPPPVRRPGSHPHRNSR
mmetsp:Transcript_10099/g.38260  ORF Transcript_10099/g.38260 Transcript_10099/m.38260 type:complete len:269 (+) Transcript_10099:6290-7096(+)